MTAWPMVPLGEVAEFLRGVTFKPSDLVDSHTHAAVACLRTKNVQAELDDSDLLFVPPGVIKNPRQYVQPGDIIVSSANSWNLIGKCSWVGAVDRPTTFGGFVSNLRVTDRRLEARYLYWWFSSPRVQTLVRSFGRQTTSISNLNMQRTLSLEIPLPPIPEQRRIAAILDRVSEATRVRQRQLGSFSQLERSLFREVARRGQGQHMSLGEVATFHGGNSLGEGEPFTGQAGGRLQLKVSDMNSPGNERVIRSAMLWTSEGSGVNVAPAGSIVIPKRGGAIATNKKRVLSRPAVLDPNLMAIAPRDSRLRSDYLFSWFESLDLATISSGSSVPQLNKQDLDPLRILVPSPDEQADLSRRLAAIEPLRDHVSAHLAKLEELFTSLQYRAFRGEL